MLVLVAAIIQAGMVMALECESGTVPVLKIEYEAEDHASCQDPSLASLPASTPRGITESVLYQTKSQRKRVDRGMCVAPVKVVKGRMIFKNIDHHQIKIVKKNRTYLINMMEKNGSVRTTINDSVYEVGPRAYTSKEYEGFEKMEILKKYHCGLLPPLPYDPSEMKICVADIGGMRVTLYKEYRSYVSDHLNWYKASNIEWVCANPNIFEPPSGVKLVKPGMY
jgi:hypothetical protein